MERCIINTPLGFAKLEGDENGISSLSILNNDVDATIIIPEVLADAVCQLNEYFIGERKTFSLKLNPIGTDFQKKV